MPIHNQFIRGLDKEASPAGLTLVGAYLTIEVHIPPEIAEVLTNKGEAVPVPKAGVGLIDTGATRCCVDDSLLQQLNLNPVGRTKTGTANGPVDVNIYPARIVFPTDGWTLDLSVIGVDLTGQFVQETPPKPIIALLGRDFLERGVFIYNGSAGSWTVTIG